MPRRGSNGVWVSKGVGLGGHTGSITLALFGSVRMTMGDRVVFLAALKWNFCVKEDRGDKK